MLRETLPESTPELFGDVAMQLGWYLWRYEAPQDAIDFLSSESLHGMTEPAGYLAFMLAGLGRTEEARAILSRISDDLRSVDPNLESFLGRLIAFTEARSAESASALATSALTMGSYSAPALVHAGEALLWAKKKDEARRLLEQAATVDPDYDRAHMLLAEIALRSLRLRDAIRHIRSGRHWNFRRLMKTS